MQFLDPLNFLRKSHFFLKKAFLVALLTAFMVSPFETTASQASQANDADLYQRGRVLMKEKKYEEAKMYLQPHVEKGDKNAQHNLGVCCFYLKEEQEAYEWFKAAREQGLQASKNNIGKMNLLYLLLPDEMLDHIISFLPFKDMESLKRVSKRACSLTRASSSYISFLKLYTLSRIYVANEYEGTISEIINGKKTKDIEVGEAPFALAVMDNRLYVAARDSNTISEIIDGKKVKDIQFDHQPRALAVMDNRLYVSFNDSSTVSEIIDGKKTKDIEVGKEAFTLAVMGHRLYVTHFLSDSVSEIIDGKKTKDIEVGKEPFALAVMGHRLYISKFSGFVSEIIDGKKTKVIWVGKEPFALAVMGHRLYASKYLDATVSEIVDGKKTKDIEVGKTPSAFAVLGDRLYVANTGSDTVSEIIDGKKTKDIEVGKAPFALAVMMPETRSNESI